MPAGSILRTVAVDAMGGDDAPLPEVEGAVAAARERLATVVLVGDEDRLRSELRRLGAGDAGIGVRHSSQVITMEDHPAQAAKTKKDSSMRVAFELVKKGEAEAVVSAGNSGAVLACGLFVWKRVAGVERPGIITTFPTKTGVCALIDMGANVDCRPQTLTQFAVLGAVYARLLHDKARPRVGILSNGAEAVKGTELTRSAHRMLSSGIDKDFEFVGYIEGRDIFSGCVDLVVTDGFTGNVVLKTSEGASAAVFDHLRTEIMASRLSKIGAWLLTGAFQRLKRRLDYAEYGGAPLIGVNGVAVLCHGGSNAKAIKNGIRVAASFARDGLPGRIAEAIGRHAQLWDAAAVGQA